jgi:hypothetical protein
MKNATLVAAVGVIALSNALALIHAARNRSGEPEAELTLTDRELWYTTSSEDSGIDLTLRWTDPTDLFAYDDDRAAIRSLRWLDVEKLRELGFDVDVDAPPKFEWTDPRQLPRPAFVALEYDGAAWQAWAERRREQWEKQPASPVRADVEKELAGSTRLISIDASPDASMLRARHPDRSRVLILPCVIEVYWMPATLMKVAAPGSKPHLAGRLRRDEMPSNIHVPLPFSAELRGRVPSYGLGALPTPSYRVRLRYGRFLEPWVVSIELEATTTR